MFVNRVAELALLEKRFDSGKAEMFVLYGRRRVGKTELLAHFCQGKRSIFFVSDLGSEISLRTSLSAAVNQVLFGPGQMNAVYATWEDLFRAIAQAAQQERLVLVLDEFPYLVSAYPPLASILQHLWDQSLRESRIFLILCGSYIGMMEEAVLGYQAPLHGRRTGQYLLEPFKFKDARLFFTAFSPPDQVRAYAVYGGTPAYLQTIQPQLSLNENIHDTIFSRGAYLYDEVRFILQQELREPRNYFAILQAIAGGNTRLNAIKQATGIDGVTAYLDTLQQLHLIERVVPVTETQPQKSRRGIYRLKDPFVRFWFRYVLPNHSRLELGAARGVLDQLVLPEMDHFASLPFEAICQQAVWQAGLAGRLSFVPQAVGNWWNNTSEIDLMAVDDSNALLGECKWTSKPVGLDIITDLEQKASLVARELEGRQIRFMLCSRSGFTPQLVESVAHRDDVALWGLSEIIIESSQTETAFLS